MDLLEFRKNFLESVRIEAEESRDFKESSFVKLYVDQLSEDGHFTDFTYAPYIREKSGSRKIKISGYSQNSFEDSISLIAADYDGHDESKSLTKSDALHFFKFMLAFVEESYSGKLINEIEISDPASTISNILNFYQKKTRKIRLFMITDKILSEQVTSLSSLKVNDIPIELHVWDIKRLFNYYCSGGESPEILITDFIENGIPCVVFSGSNEYESILCAVPGGFLADLYDKMGTTLLEGNIRSFLSTKVAVNKRIRYTINNDATSFFMLNNGISATASSVTYKHFNENICLCSMVDFQIVNGGQTTASLSNARFVDKADLSKIAVPMKLTIINKDDAKIIIPKIAECANTQNKVNAADFFSNKEYAIQIERLSRKIFAPAKDGSQHDTHWFFERAKGQYLREQMRKSKSEIARFVLQNPKNQVFSKTDLAKYINSWSGLPHIVSRGAQTNFQVFAETIIDKYEQSKDSIHDDYFKETVALAILFKCCEAIVSDQPWYGQGYRAQIVTYTLALFSHLIKEQFIDYSLDTKKIWDIQSVPIDIQKQLIEIAYYVNNSINDVNRETINVTQWCKREKCWDTVKRDCLIHLDKKIMLACIMSKDKKDREKIAEKDAKLTNSVTDEISVFNKKVELWNRLLVFSQNRGIATSDQLIALKVASSIPNRLPNAYQCKILIKLLDKALQEGFQQNTDENKE